MSRKTFAAIIVTILCFAAAIFGLSYACVFTEQDGLTVISHGIHVIPQNQKMMIEKMEQFAEDDYRYFIACGGVNVADSKREGVVITMRYITPQPLTWIEPDGSESPILAERITVTIPDQYDHSGKMSYYVIVDQPGRRPGMATLQMPRDQVNELLELAGFSHRITGRGT